MPLDPEDEESSGDPPHPLDRVWFHPSEVSAYMADTGAPATGGSWRVALVAAFVGALLSIGVLGAAGVLDDDAATRIEQSRLTAVSAAAGGVEHIVEAAGSSIVAIRAVRATGVDSASGVALGRTQVLASASLVAGAASVTVSTRDGRVLPATVAGTDPATDLALLVIDTRAADGGPRRDRELEPATLGSADSLGVGQMVVALGVASGDHMWSGRGVVSSLNRLVEVPSGLVLAGLVETDTRPSEAIGGGPLVDADGAVVGILTRVVPGHAVPIEVARDVADQLATTGAAHHGWIGLDAIDAGDRPGGGARVVGVTPGGPAEAAGLRVDDVIVRVGDDRVTDLADLAAAISHRRAGDPVSITFWRITQRMHRDVELGKPAADAKS